MKITVCLRRDTEGEISPFEQSAYECALDADDAEITLLTMGTPEAAKYLSYLTRLGAEKAVALCDTAFAGADTVATVYALSLAIKKLKPDYIFCGRATLEGSTGQIGAMLAEKCGFDEASGVMKIIYITEKKAVLMTRDGEKTVSSPAVLNFERINELRAPGIFSSEKGVEILNAEELGADTSKCGFKGSLTKVEKTFESEYGRRKCLFYKADDVKKIIAEALEKQSVASEPEKGDFKGKVWAVGEKAYKFGVLFCKSAVMVKNEELEKALEKETPDVILWENDFKGRTNAARTAVRLNAGLCADVIRLEEENGNVFMYRPAKQGSITAKIKCLTKPALATVCVEQKTKQRIIFSVGYGAKDESDAVFKAAEKMSAGVCCSRRIVDEGIMPYEKQVGLTGKSISPDVYIALGISGAAQHIAGMEKAKTVIAVNTDKKAKIFDYADYGFVMTAEEFLKKI